MAQSVDDAAGAAKRSRGFSRLAWWTARSQQTPQHPKALAPLLQAVAHNHPKAGAALGRDFWEHKKRLESATTAATRSSNS